MDITNTGNDRTYLERRLREETAAALDASDARAAAAHVGLATCYLQQLNGGERREQAVPGAPE